MSGLLNLLAPEARLTRRLIWAGVAAVVAIAGMIFFSLPVRAPAQATAERYLARLPLAQVLAPTRVERREAAELSFQRDPLPPAAPPAQATMRPAGQLFGIRDDRRAAYQRATAALRGAQEGCRGRPSSPPSGLAEAASNLSAAREAATQERAIFSYHQGLIELCSGSGHAAQQFETALTTLDRDKPAGDCVGHPDSHRDCRIWLQFRAAALYGAGLAEMAGGGSPDRPAARFRDALAAAEAAEAVRDIGPFVVLRGAERELFDFSTAEVVNAQLYLHLARGRPQDAWRAVEERHLAPLDLAPYPGLAVNWASAAAAGGETRQIGQLLAAVRSRIQAGDGGAWQAPGNPALARLAALAAMSPDRIFVQGDEAWWPPGRGPSRVRAAYEQRHGAAGEEWFPSLGLDEADAEVVDQWLWIRRERGLIARRSFAEFRDEGPDLNALDPRPKRTLNAWRREVMQVLGGQLYDEAETVLRDRGAAQARPLFEILAGPEYGTWVNMRARMVLLTGAPAWVGFAIAGLLLAGLGMMAWLHFAFAAGYRRTFTHRHYDQRRAREADAAA
jgi:hypothetical protein